LKLKKEWRIAPARILLGCAIVIAFVLVRGTRAGDEPVHLVTDWSHRHMVFSDPKSLFQAFELSGNPRYLQQWIRRNAERKRERWNRHQEDPLNGDWSVYLGAGGKVGAGVYPAKYSFSAGTANCGSAPQPDFVVYNTSLTPSAASAKATQTGTFTSIVSFGSQTVIITNPNILAPAVNSITLTSSTTVNTGTNFQVGALALTTTQEAANLAAAIARNDAGIGVTATSAGAVVTVAATNGGTDNNRITLTTTVTGFTWAAGTLAGGANGASIVAYDNLYSGCTLTVPSVYWAYNTGGSVVTSVALSLDGTQVAFVQTVGTTANLVLLKWKASTTETVDSPTTLTAVGTAAYRACGAPCMTTITFSGNANDTNSSPFYDFAQGSDTLYVGDDNSALHKFTGVFNGTPAEAGGAWPVTLAAATTTLTSPVFDDAVGKVFVANGLPGGATGSLFAVTTAGVVTASARMTAGLGFVDGPLVDSTNGQVYLATADVNTTLCTTPTATSSAIIQFPVGFAANATATSVATMGTCNRTASLYMGEFDNAYYSGGAGHMFACGNAGGTPTLYQITVSATGNLTAGAATVGPPLATAAASCSPVAEVYNPNATGGAKDWIFVSVQANGKTTAPQSCPSTGGCIMSFNVTSSVLPITPATATVGHAGVAGGASGVVVDNTVGSGTLAGASQVYFTPLADGTCATSGGLGGCAVQASQSALN